MLIIMAENENTFPAAALKFMSQLRMLETRECHPNTLSDKLLHIEVRRPPIRGGDRRLKHNALKNATTVIRGNARGMRPYPY